jgi:hypothetical protein
MRFEQRLHGEPSCAMRCTLILPERVAIRSCSGSDRCGELGGVRILESSDSSIWSSCSVPLTGALGAGAGVFKRFFGVSDTRPLVLTATRRCCLDNALRILAASRGEAGSGAATPCVGGTAAGMCAYPGTEVRYRRGSRDSDNLSGRAYPPSGRASTPEQAA